MNMIIKKTFLFLILVFSLVACKKEKTTQSSNDLGKPGANITDNEGNVYKTVTIGNQHWMAENLKVSKYNDGSAIPNINIDSLWKNNTTGAWAYHNNDTTNNAKYGKLYNWFVVNPTMNGNKNVCPSGWHVPTDAEWTVLTNFLGGELVAGGKMKEVDTISWNKPNTAANNKSLFTALPGGSRNYDGTFEPIGKFGNWWTSTEDYTFFAWYRNLNESNGAASKGSGLEESGFSVRCLRD